MGSVLGKVLVTGCSGLVGTHVVKKLLEKNYSVHGVDIAPMKEIINDERFLYSSADLRESDDVVDMFDGMKYDGVINCFGIKGSPIRAKESPLDFLEPSIKVNTNIIENSHKHNCWLVFMSSVGVYEPAEEFVEDTVWKTLPSPNDWFPSWSKRIPELYLEAHKVQHARPIDSLPIYTIQATRGRSLLYWCWLMLAQSGTSQADACSAVSK